VSADAQADINSASPRVIDERSSFMVNLGS